MLHDTYFYWTHRFFHLPIFFNWIHKTHHRSHNPTPWAAFSFHPVEAIISAGIIPLIIFCIPCHPFSIFTFLTFMTLINVVGHLGYEIFPKSMARNRILKWQNSSTNHNLHHKQSKYNYGLYFTFWDRITENLPLSGAPPHPCAETVSACLSARPPRLKSSSSEVLNRSHYRNARWPWLCMCDWSDYSLPGVKRVSLTNISTSVFHSSVFSHDKLQLKTSSPVPDQHIVLIVSVLCRPFDPCHTKRMVADRDEIFFLDWILSPFL